MRDIKFRAWNFQLKKYIKVIEMNITGNMVRTWDEKFYAPFEVILEQYTGLKDKNGVEIYEGDIVQINGDYDYIGFEDYEFCTMIKHEPLANYVYDTANGEPKFQDDIFHVVGNIHENADLLEEQS